MGNSVAASTSSAGRWGLGRRRAIVIAAVVVGIVAPVDVGRGGSVAAVGGPFPAIELVDVSGPLQDVGGTARGGFRLAVRNNGPDAVGAITVTLTPPGAGSLAFISGRPVIDAPRWDCGAPAADDTVVCSLPGLAGGETSPTITDTSRLYSVWGEPSHVAAWRISYSAEGVEYVQSRPPGWRFETSPPANDVIANATDLAGATGSLATSTWGTTVVPGRGPGEDGTGSAWYRLVASCPGTVTLSTTNVTGSIPFWASPQLEVFAGTPVSGLSEQARSYSQFTSSQQVRVPVRAGDILHVALVSRVTDPAATADGFYTYGDFGGRGEIDLSWTTDCLTATLSPERPPDHDGWYTAPVLMTASSSSGQVEIATTGAQAQIPVGGGSPQTVAVSVDGTTTVQATALSADVRGEPVTSTVRLDQTPPTVQISVPVADATYPSDALPSAAFTCTDLTSGSASCSASVAAGVALDGAIGDHTFTVTAVDNAGNATTRSVIYHVVAGTNLTLLLTPDRPPGPSGWYTSPVTLTAVAPAPAFALFLGATAPGGWTANGTGLPVSPLTSRLRLTQDRIYTVTATANGPNQAGGQAATTRVLTVQVDTSPPTISIAVPQGRPTYVKDESVSAVYSCSDGLSGVATCSGSEVTGGILDTTTVGRHTLVVTSTDVAGNRSRASQTYDVIPGDHLTVTISGADGFSRTGTASTGDIVATRTGNQLTTLSGVVTLDSAGSRDTITLGCLNQRAAFLCGVSVTDVSPGLPRRTFVAGGSIPIIEANGHLIVTLPSVDPRRPYSITIDIVDKT